MSRICQKKNNFFCMVTVKKRTLLWGYKSITLYFYPFSTNPMLVKNLWLFLYFGLIEIFVKRKFLFFELNPEGLKLWYCTYLTFSFIVLKIYLFRLVFRWEKLWDLSLDQNFNLNLDENERVFQLVLYISYLLIMETKIL